MKSIKSFISESKRQNDVEYICRVGDVLWVSTQVDSLDALKYSGFLQDANCCFKVSVKDTDIEEGKFIILTSHVFYSEDEAQEVEENYTGDLNDYDWDWDSDGFMVGIHNGYALYVGATALQGGRKETVQSIENVLRQMKPVN